MSRIGNRVITIPAGVTVEETDGVVTVKGPKGTLTQDYDNKINVSVAGLPKRLGKYVTFENFKIGFSLLASDDTVDHKLTYKHVDGGVMLVETDFTIK